MIYHTRGAKATFKNSPLIEVEIRAAVRIATLASYPALQVTHKKSLRPCRPGRAQGLGVQGILENLPGHTIGVKMRVAYVVCRCCCVGSAARVPLSAKSPSRNSKCSSQAVAYDDQVLCHGHFGREIQNVFS